MKNQTQNVAAPTAAPMIDAYPVVASSRRLDAGLNGGLTIMPMVGVTAHATGQVSVASANIVFSTAWAPPPRREPL